MAQLGIRIYPETLRSIDASTFTGAYIVFGTPTQYPGVILRIVNSSTVDVLISWNGTDSHEVVPTGSFLLLDIAANLEKEKYLNISKGTQFYIRGEAGTGFVYLSYYYAY